MYAGEPTRLRAPNGVDVGGGYGVSWCRFTGGSIPQSRPAIPRHTAVVRGLISKDAKAQLFGL